MWSTNAQFTLVTVGIVVSTVLTLVVTILARKREEDLALTKTNIVLLLVSIFTLAVGVVLGVLAIGLLWAREIETDVFGLAIVSLIPSFQALPQLRIAELIAVSRAQQVVRKKLKLKAPTLSYCRFDELTSKGFFVVRKGAKFGRSPVTCIYLKDKVGNALVGTFNQPNEHRSWVKHVYFRKLHGPHTENQAFLKFDSARDKEIFWIQAAKKNANLVAEKLWFGDVVDFDESLQWVELNDSTIGYAEQMWYKTLNASRILHRYSEFHFASFEASCNMIVAILEILMVAQVIRKYALNELWKVACNRGFQDSLSRTPGICCRRIVASLDLGWPSPRVVENEESLKNVFADELALFSFMFQMIAEKSELFTAVHDKRLTAHDLIKSIQESGLGEANRGVVKWLFGWNVVKSEQPLNDVTQTTNGPKQDDNSGDVSQKLTPPSQTRLTEPKELEKHESETSSPPVSMA